MCLCAFLYFTEFSTLNINYFCNQKKHTVIKSIKKCLSHPISPLSLPLCYRQIPSQQCAKGADSAWIPPASVMLVTAY